MTLYTPPNLTEGIDDAIIGTAATVPSFIPMFLVFIFGVVFLSGVINQKRRTGNADFPMWSVVASLSTLMMSMPLTLKAGLINLPTLSVVVVVTIMSGFWLFMNRNRNEI